MEIVIPVLIGAAIGAALTLCAILGNFKLKTNEAWEQEERRHENTITCLVLVQAENARLRVALAAGEMTEEGKRVAAMTMAALRAVISAESRLLLRALPGTASFLRGRVLARRLQEVHRVGRQTDQ